MSCCAPTKRIQAPTPNLLKSSLPSIPRSPSAFPFAVNTLFLFNRARTFVLRNSSCRYALSTSKFVIPASYPGPFRPPLLSHIPQRLLNNHTSEEQPHGTI